VDVIGHEYSVALRDFGSEELPTLPVQHRPELGRFRWTCETPILKNQGIYIAWYPTPAEHHAL